MRRAGVIALLLFQATFLNIVMPGHLRGVVTLTGRSSSERIGDLVCGGCCAKKASKTPAKQPTRQERADCAICSIAAHLMTPPVVDLALTDHGPAFLNPESAPQRVESATYVHTYDACGPPVRS
jgi:hypothetical protein